jgi:hypothetical protein
MGAWKQNVPKKFLPRYEQYGNKMATKCFSMQRIAPMPHETRTLRDVIARASSTFAQDLLGLGCLIVALVVGLNLTALV